MQVSVLEAGGQLAELVRRAQGGDEIVLTVDGQPAIRLALVPPAPNREPSAARSQDFLYDEDGLPK